MDNSWQSQCGSIWPSSPQLHSQESLNQMLNAGNHFYPRMVQEPCSSARGLMLEPTLPCTSSLNLYNTGHAELGSSFLSLLSGPPSALQCDLQQLSDPKPFIASGKALVNGSNVMVSSAGSRVSPTGIFSQNLDSLIPKPGVDQQSSDLAKTLIHHNVFGTEKVKEFSTLRGRWFASSRPAHVGKSSSSNVQAPQKVLESNASVPRQSSPLTSGCPRVFCLGASGDLLLSNTGLLGVVCSCHGLNMSITKFSEHSGLRDVNPGDAIHLDNGETIAQWRKIYFHKFGIRVPDDHSGWDWPEGFSTYTGTVKCSATAPNISRSSISSNFGGGPSGALQGRQNNIVISNNPHTGQKLVNEVLPNEKQRNTQDGWNFLNRPESQIESCPMFGFSTMSKLVGLRGPENDSHSISTYNDSISKNGSSFISFPHSQNLKPPCKDSDVVRFYNSKVGDNVNRPAVSSNIELRLGQPSQQGQTLGKPILPSFGSHIIAHDHYPQKSTPLDPMIHSGSHRDKEECRQYFQCAAGTSKSNIRREKNHLNFVNSASGVYGATDAVQTEQLKGDLARGSVISMLLSHSRSPTEGEMQSKASDNVANGSCLIPGKLISESRTAKCDPVNFIRNRGNGAETQFNVGSWGTHTHEGKGKGVECPADLPHFATEFNFGFYKNQKGSQCSSGGVISETGHYTSSVILDPLSDASDTRNPFNCVGKSGYLEHVPLRSISSALDYGPILPSQAVTVGVSRMTSVSLPNLTPTASNKEGIGVSPYLLNGNLGMLALRNMLELSNQDHAISSLGTTQEHRNYSNPYVDKIKDSIADPSPSTERRHGLKHPNIEMQHQRPHDRCPNEQPLLRLGRSVNTVNSSALHGECCQRVRYACCQDNCSPAVHTNSMLFPSKFGDCNSPRMTTISAAQSGVLHMKNLKKVECQAFQWRDVPSKVTSKDPPVDLFDNRENIENQIATSAAKCSNRSVQNAEFLKEQEFSNVSSGCSAPAITQVSVKVSNEDSCTVGAQDMRCADNLVVDESSGIDKCWSSSDDGVDSERSTEFENIASQIKSMNKGSSKAFAHQSSRSLIDELRLRDSLRSKKIRNQIHGVPTVNEKSNHVQKTEGGSKFCHRKKAPKWKLLDASFPTSIVSSDHNCACSTGPSSKQRFTVSSSKTVSHKRNLNRLYFDKEGEFDCEAQLSFNDNILENSEASHGKQFRSDHADPTVKHFWRQEPYSPDDEMNVNVRKRKARPLVCGKYGIISNGDTSKPAKLLSIKKILQNTRIFDLAENDELKSISTKELKNKRHKGCSSKSTNFMEEREKVGEDASEYSDMDPSSKDVRKRSLYELTTEAEASGKDPSCSKSSSIKNSNCGPRTRSSYVGKFPKNVEHSRSHASEEHNASKLTKEFSLQSKSDLDALCCVCGSSDKQEINCLLECHGCLIRVHQACYGVSKVPRTHWYCRPCKTSSKNIVCVLCGYGGGAMTQALQSHNIAKSLLKNWNFETKSMPTESLEDQLVMLTSSRSLLDTDSLPVMRPEHMNSSPLKNSSFAPISSMMYNSITTGVFDSNIKQWVHMVCGLWTPGTRCPNVDTMSAFDVSGAPHPKANVVCSMCNRPGGSCIRCRVVDCSVLFHPWCAHQKGLLQSEVEGVDNENLGFYGRCELHATQHQHNFDHDPSNIGTNRPGEKEFTCARTEGYKGRKRDGFRHHNPRQSEGTGGCFVPQEQLNAWLHINKLKSRTKGLPKVTHSDVEHDCRKEYARYRQSKAWKHLVVYKSGIHALGLYTSQFISRGAMVVEYVGEIVGLRVADKRESEYQSGRKLQYKSACYFFRIDKEHIIDATRKGGIARFVNHSCSPNCVAKVISVRTERKVVFFAERDIYPGEEITYDYHFNNEDEGKKIPCFCNSKNCRRYLN